MLGILLTAALAGTVFPLVSIQGMQVVLSSCAVILLTRLHGVAWGVLGGALAAITSFVVWHQPVTALLLPLEALIVAMLLRRGMKSLLAADGIFWILFGLPLQALYLAIGAKSGGLVIAAALFGGMATALINAVLAATIDHFVVPFSRRVPLLWQGQFNLILGCFLLPAVGVILFNSGAVRDVVGSDLEQKLADDCNGAWKRLSAMRTQVGEDIWAMAAGTAPGGKLPTAESLRQKADALRRKHPVLATLFVAAPDGRVLAVSSSKSSSRSEPRTPWLSVEQIGLASGVRRPGVFVAVTEVASQEPRLVLTVPIFENERLVGLIGGIIDPIQLGQLLNELNGLPTVALNLIDEKGQQLSGIVTPVGPVTANSSNGWFERLPQDHTRYFFWNSRKQKLEEPLFLRRDSFARLSGEGRQPLLLSARIPRDAHQSHLQIQFARSLVVMLLPAFAAMMLAPLLTRRLTTPLKQLARATDDLPEKIRRNEKIEWPQGAAPEVESLVDNFRTVSFSLEQSYKEMESLQEASEATLDRYLTSQRWEVFTAGRKLQQEIDKRRRIEQLLERIEAAETKYRFLVEKTMVGVYIIQDHRLAYTNPRFGEIFGLSSGEIERGISFLDLIVSDDKAFVSGQICLQTIGEASNLQFEFRGCHRDGSHIYLEAHCTPSTFNGQPAIFGTLLDITERRNAEEKVRHMAYHDPLTGLPNRILFNDRVEQAIVMARRSKQIMALLFVDLDRFKSINDTLGHHAGDRLLQEMAERLRGCIRESDTVSRFGGDEFNLLLAQVHGEVDAALVAQKILRALRLPFVIDGQELHGTGSIGMALFPRDGSDVQTLIKNADIALYRAKDLGRNNCQIYKPAMNAQAVERMELENSLHRVLDRHELRVYYQPQVDLKSGRIVGMEALLRWQHPKGGMISPATFIPLAEEIGLIFPIGEWMMRTACRQAKLWQDQGFEPIRLGVNVSPQQFQDREFMEVLSRILDQFKLEPRWLNVELTESIVMQDVRENILKLKQLHAFGITVAIDDFGVGYSSLSYLRNFPVDQLKMDRSFVQNLPDSPNDAKIARHIVEMAHSLGLTVIAEGVETVEQLQFLKEIGCDEAQGFLLSKPVPADLFEEQLRSSVPLSAGCCQASTFGSPPA